MRRELFVPNLEEAVELLRARGVAVEPWSGAEGGQLARLNGAGAVIVAERAGKWERGRLALQPGWMVGGRPAELVDRGFQKFWRTEAGERVATAEQLQAVHRLSEELKLALGEESLYNESLGSTSLHHDYDRLRQQEEEPEAEAHG